MSEGREFFEFAAVLDAAGSVTEQQAATVVQQSALRIKDAARRDMESSRHFKSVARSIDFDISGGNFFGGNVIEAEIGPTKGSPGSLANIAYFGSSKGGGGTVRDLGEPLNEEAPNFERALGELIERSMR